MVAQRTLDISSFIVMDVLERAVELEAQGANVIHLEVGEPDFDTPECVKRAAIKALNDGFTHYTHSLGMPTLRAAVAAYYQRRYQVAVSPDNILVTAGTSPAMLLMFAALLETDDEVILSDPYYACYPNFIRILKGKPVTVPIFEEDGFQLRPQDIAARITPRTRAVFINSPSNPTGNLLSRARLQAIAGLGPLVISDEIYHGLVYDDEDHSILEFTDNAFVLNGFSKLYAMTGLRLGYVIAPPQYMAALRKMHQNFFISANSMVQQAGIAALQEAGADVKRMVAIYNQRRRFMVDRLRELGFGITVEPTGAFYVFANAKHVSHDSYRLAFDILENAHVGVTPGIDFGPHGEGYLRFCYANSMENIAEGLMRLERYLQ